MDLKRSPRPNQCFMAVTGGPKDKTDLRELADSLPKFWALEAAPELSRMSLDDIECKHLFPEDAQRNDPGHYIARSTQIARDLSANYPTTKSVAWRAWNAVHGTIMVGRKHTRNLWPVTNQCAICVRSKRPMISRVRSGSSKSLITQSGRCLMDDQNSESFSTFPGRPE